MPATDDSPAAHLDLQSLLRRSFRLLLAHPLVFIVAYIILIVGSTLTLGIAAGPLLVGYIRMIDRASREEQIEIGEILEGLPSFAPALLTFFVISIAALIGSALVVLPGVVVLVIWSYAMWFVALRDNDTAGALRASWHLVRDQVGSVLLVLVAVVLLNLVGSLVVLGVLITAPLGLVIMTLSFNELTA